MHSCRLLGGVFGETGPVTAAALLDRLLVALDAAAVVRSRVVGAVAVGHRAARHPHLVPVPRGVDGR